MLKLKSVSEVTNSNGLEPDGWKLFNQNVNVYHYHGHFHHHLIKKECKVEWKGISWKRCGGLAVCKMNHACSFFSLLWQNIHTYLKEEVLISFYSFNPSCGSVWWNRNAQSKAELREQVSRTQWYTSFQPRSTFQSSVTIQ